MSIVLRLRNLATGPWRSWVLLQASRRGKEVEKTCLLFSSLGLEDVQWHLTLPKGELGTGAPWWQTETLCKHFYLCLYEMQLITLQGEWMKRGRWGRVWILNVHQFLVELWGNLPGQGGPPHWFPSTAWSLAFFLSWTSYPSWDETPLISHPLKWLPTPLWFTLTSGLPTGGSPITPELERREDPTFSQPHTDACVSGLSHRDSSAGPGHLQRHGKSGCSYYSIHCSGGCHPQIPGWGAWQKSKHGKQLLYAEPSAEPMVVCTTFSYLTTILWKESYRLQMKK